MESLNSVQRNIEQDNQRQAALYGYAAGLIDGEGCLRIGRNKGSGQLAFYIQVGMVTPEPLYRLQEMFGGNIRQERVQSGRHMYRWVLCKQELILNCLDKIDPFLLVKHRQSKLLREAINLKKRDRSLAPKKLTTKELQQREQFFQEMKKLNLVGAAATTNRENIREDEVIV